MKSPDLSTCPVNNVPPSHVGDSVTFNRARKRPFGNCASSTDASR